MKRFALIILSCIIWGFTSCDPDVPGEEINLPEMHFGFKVFPDTAYIKLGDTIILHSSIPSTLSNGIKVEDGKATIDLFMSQRDEIPVVNIDNETVVIGTHMDLLEEKGSIRINPSTNKIVELYAYPYEDSIQVRIKFIPLKTGTFRFSAQSKFYEGSSGKTRTQPYFDMEDTHWDLYQIPEHPGPNPGEESYYKSYWFAVYE